jgi:hypothetical protein
LIRKLIATTTWDKPGAVIEAIHDQLIIRHRTDVLDEIEELLQELDLWRSQSVVRSAD